MGINMENTKTLNEGKVTKRCKVKCMKKQTKKVIDDYNAVYLKERNCLRDIFSGFLQIFAKFAKLNPREKSTGSQFAKLNPREKNFFFVFQIIKTYIFTLVSPSVNNDHVKIFYRISNNLTKDNIEREM